jgi:hypothetical protein
MVPFYIWQILWQDILHLSRLFLQLQLSPFYLSNRTVSWTIRYGLEPLNKRGAIFIAGGNDYKCVGCCKVYYNMHFLNRVCGITVYKYTQSAVLTQLVRKWQHVSAYYKAIRPFNWLNWPGVYYKTRICDAGEGLKDQLDRSCEKWRIIT